IDNGLSDLSVEPKTDDLLRPKHVDSLDLEADANLQLQFTLEVYEIENKERLIKVLKRVV
ncbi:unnamed protein product, partial [Rotaria magnacalcarata]